MKVLLNILCLTGIAFITISAQRVPTAEEKILRDNRVVTESFKDLERISDSRTQVGVRSLYSYKRVFHILPDTPERIALSPEQVTRLLPNSEDSASFESFLKTPKTGLIKMFPEKKCASKYVLDVNEPCQNAIPRSSFYSFRKGNYSIQALSDISLRDSSFISEGLQNHGMLVMLGDIPIENVSTNSDGVKFLSEYKPAKKSKDASIKREELTRGVKDSNYDYSWTAKVRENTTYAIRVIAYGGEIWTKLWGDAVYDILDDDKRIDIIIVFRVIRVNKDGIITILWKELERKKSPKVNFSLSSEEKQKYDIPLQIKELR